jgi:hypothetical protein
MKLDMHPVSMTSRPVRLFVAENKIPLEEQMVDLIDCSQRPLDRAQERLPVRRTDHHRRLLRNRLAHPRRNHPLRFSPYPNLQRWVANMKRLPSWSAVNQVFDGFAASVKDQPFQAI